MKGSGKKIVENMINYIILLIFVVILGKLTKINMFRIEKIALDLQTN
jgi:hypothetical protein